MVARMKPSRLLALLLVGLPLACREDEPQVGGQTPPPPAGTSAATGVETTTAEGTTASAHACGCAPDQFCAAIHDGPGAPAPAPEDYTCLDECVPPDAPGLWCFDDTSCCSGTCANGLCTAMAATDGGTATDDGSTTGATTTDGSTTGATTSGSSG